jgi:predicted sulfurtransferase
MSDIEKYEKKVAKAARALQTLTDKNEIKEAKHTMDKYQKKIEKARTNSSSSAVVSGADAPPAADAKPVDKSGLTLLLFYAYVEPPWTHERHREAIEWVEALLNRLRVTGRLRVSREGFNGTLTGPYDGIRTFTDEMRAYDNGRFSWMNNKDDFKLTDNLPLGQKFPKLKVFSVKELVNYGLGVDGAPSVFEGGVHLDPEDYDKKLHEPNTVVIDVRNSYEADIGRFAPEHGAEYIDPKMRISTEFPAWVKENIDSFRDKQVMMYCTGGIRCERASAFVRSLGHDRVYQLKGGIHNYLDHYEKKGGGGCWVGENYAFDKRFSHGTSNGDSEAKSVAKPAPPDNAKQVGNCCGCGISWSKYRGKKRCLTCGVPLLLCPACIKGDMDKKGAVCALCKEDKELGRPAFNKRMAKDGIIRSGECGNEEDFDDEGSVCSGGSAGATRDAYANTKYKRGGHECGVCHEEFKTRNALFRHIQDFGHMNRKKQRKK